MNPLEVPLALFAFVGIVAIVPVWMWYVGEYAGQLQPEARFLAQFALPCLVALFLASWIQTG